jgi:beta-glucosidase
MSTATELGAFPWPEGFGWGNAPQGTAQSDIGWPILPDAFRDELVDLTRRFRLPVYVTENGVGSSDEPDRDGKVRDPRRVRYFEAYVAAMQEAIGMGADVRGYFVWSPLDNFEWDSGYANRFGLVYVDYATQQRVPKTSYGWYRDLIEAARRPTRKV